MEHFIRIAFWIVALAACLQGSPLPSGQVKDNKTVVEVSDITPLETTTCGGEFYSPTNVEKECFITALECVKNELKTILTLKGTSRKNCTAIIRVPQALNVISSNAIPKVKAKWNLTPNNSSECDCQMWDTHPFDGFVEKIKSLLESINSTR